MKKNIKKIKRFVNHHQYECAIGLISIVALIIGTFAIGFLMALLIVGGIDVILCIPSLLSKTGSKSKRTAESVHGKHAAKDTKGKNGKKKWNKKKILIILFSFFILCLILFIAFVSYIIMKAPQFDPDKLYHQEATIIYDVKGNVIAKLGSENREKITYDEMPEVLVNAIVATEDSRFFQHNGFDLPRFVKASLGTVIGKDAGGASTLTMQIAKNHFTSIDRSITRKFTDIYMSIFQIEKHYTKKEIMEFYVNAPYLGSGAWGVEQACQTYFGKSAKDINLAEAAVIAGLFQAPNSYDPHLYPEKTEQRRKTVLYLMERHGYITKAERVAAEKLTIETLLKKSGTGSSDNYQAFIDTVVEDVEEITGKNPYNQSMQIYTTMDKEKQGYVDGIMNGTSGVYSWENDAVNAGAAVIDVKTGAIAAVGAGRNRTGQRSYNTATMIKRQIGSTAKPIYDYAPGIEYQNWSTYTPFADEPHTYSTGVSIDNWDRKFDGFMTLRHALAESRNIPALKAFQSNKNVNIKNMATSLGLSPEVSDNIVHEAHALGGYNGESPLSMSAAYAAFANGGYYVKPYTFTKIVYRATGEVYEHKPKKEKVMSPETAYMIANVLYDASDFGVGGNGRLDNGARFAAKTGTSNFTQKVLDTYNFPGNAVNDLWVTGFNPDYAISVWYGYDKINADHVSTTNTGEHRYLFKKIANGFFQSGSDFVKPAGVIPVEIEYETYPAMLPSANTPANMRRTELFKKGTEPTEVSKRFTTLDAPTNLSGKLSGNSLTLTWNKIKSVNDTDSLKAWVGTLFKDSNYAGGFLNERVNYNNSVMGEIGYNVYAKDTSGNLSLIGFTTDSKIAFNVKSGSASSYVVKASYSILKSCESAGVETKVDLGNVKVTVTSSLNGDSTMTIAIDGDYVEKSVKVLEDSTDVTKKATINISIKDKDGKSVTDIDTSAANTYTISYSISYDDYTNTLTRTVYVK